MALASRRAPRSIRVRRTCRDRHRFLGHLRQDEQRRPDDTRLLGHGGRGWARGRSLRRSVLALALQRVRVVAVVVGAASPNTALQRTRLRAPLSFRTFGDRRSIGAPGHRGSRQAGPQYVSW